MPTQPPTDARRHYREAERLLDAAVETPANAPMLALAHATLANVDPRKLRRRKQAPEARPYLHGDSPAQRWLRGDE